MKNKFVTSGTPIEISITGYNNGTGAGDARITTNTISDLGGANKQQINQQVITGVNASGSKTIKFNTSITAFQMYETIIETKQLDGTYIGTNRKTYSIDVNTSSVESLVIDPIAPVKSGLGVVFNATFTKTNGSPDGLTASISLQKLDGQIIQTQNVVTSGGGKLTATFIAPQVTLETQFRIKVAISTLSYGKEVSVTFMVLPPGSDGGGGGIFDGIDQNTLILLGGVAAVGVIGAVIAGSK